jgi:hypothetical protein
MAERKVTRLTKLFNLPTWFLTRVLLVLNKEHQLNSYKPSLEQWTKYHTELTDYFNIAFWVIGVTAATLLYSLITQL